MGIFRKPAFLAAVAMTVLLSLYLVFVAQYAFAFLAAESWAARALGAALLVLPAIGAWYVIVEWRLGTTVQRMADQLEAEGGLPLHDGERLPNGQAHGGRGAGHFRQCAGAGGTQCGGLASLVHRRVGVRRQQGPVDGSAFTAPRCGTVPRPAIGHARY
ncbi:hypothetical protein [Demequina litorisediminis]|uniref:Uncharacterized protein n=1 Tax=Demequina litorisediminis TaxID=1849022 RepID=A0ABQ6IIZ4_9MICO|nr:hypothetical protein [Demequina litorisediminis]GMA37093.1 hypothetical protein GCM10025876_32970 [Demequina litorisediminis]